LQLSRRERFDYNPRLQVPEDGPVVRTIVQANTRGDAESSPAVNIGDPVYLINYGFKGGSTPVKDRCH
jgi:hypothetical protein